MARKSSKTKSDVSLKRKQLEEIELQLKAELDAETQLLEDVEKQIQTTADSNNMFCGIILTPSDLLNVIELAMKTGENIKIPFKVYYNE